MFATLLALIVSQAAPIEGTITVRSDGGTTVIQITGTIQTFAPDASVKPDAVAPKPDAAPLDAGPKPDAALADSGTKPDAAPAIDGGAGIFDPDQPSAVTPPGLRFTLAPMTAPALGARGLEPTFKTTVRKLLTAGAHEYSQLQAFSDDGQYVLLIEDGYGYSIYLYSSMAPVWRVEAKDPHAAAWTGRQEDRVEVYALRWLAGTQKLVYMVGSPARIFTFDATNGTRTEVLRMPELALATSWTNEQPSDDGRFTIAYAHQGNNLDGRIIVADLVNKREHASMTLASLYAGPCAKGPNGEIFPPNWLRASPLSKYLMIQWNRSGNSRCSGLELYDLTTLAFVRNVHGHGHHSDPTVVSGREAIVAVDFARNYEIAVVEWLDGSPYTELRLLDWYAWSHVSCRSSGPWCVVSGYGVPNEGVGYAELYLLDLRNGDLRHLAHHRSTAADYWRQPKATISRDGRRVVWTSDWGSTSNPGASYAVELPVIP